jgi:hypothetical protein
MLQLQSLTNSFFIHDNISSQVVDKKGKVLGGHWMNSSVTPICSLNPEKCHPKSY